MEIRLQSIATGCHDGGIGIFHHFTQIISIDGGHLIAGGVILAIGFIKIGLGQVGGSGSTCRASFVGLRVGQVVIGKLEVVCYLLPSLIVSIRCVRQVVILRCRKVFIIGKNNLLVELLLQEVTMSTEKTHLGNALLLFGIAIFIHPVEQLKGSIGTRDAIIQTLPHVVDVPSGSHDTL